MTPSTFVPRNSFRTAAVVSPFTPPRANVMKKKPVLLPTDDFSIGWAITQEGVRTMWKGFKKRAGHLAERALWPGIVITSLILWTWIIAAVAPLIMAWYATK